MTYIKTNWADRYRLHIDTDRHKKGISYKTVPSVIIHKRGTSYHVTRSLMLPDYKVIVEIGGKIQIDYRSVMAKAMLACEWIEEVF